eukprot:3432607-Pyramimonas_sp.AAC.1
MGRRTSHDHDDDKKGPSSRAQLRKKIHRPETVRMAIAARRILVHCYHGTLDDELRAWGKVTLSLSSRPTERRHTDSPSL